MQILMIVIFFILGAIFASFTGVIAERIHTGQAWWKGRSRCNSCRRHLSGLDLVPIISWTLQRGRCRVCKARIASAYTFFELVLAIVFAAAYVHFGFTLLLPLFLCVAVLLGFIVLYDLRHTIVPIWSSAALVILSGVFCALQSGSSGVFLYSLETALAIALGFLALHLLSKGRAMGLGDTPISFALSLLTGYQQAWAGLVFSFWIGAVIGICLLVGRRGSTTIKSEIPFVPFLAAGYLLALFTGWNPFAFMW